MDERRRFCAVYLPMDFRNLLMFVQDGQANEWLGFRDREDYIRNGLGLAPEVVEWAITGLRLLG